MNNPGPLGRGETRRLLEAYGLSPAKALGQHFVTDPNTLERIVRLSQVGEGDAVLEIGAGLGSLTRALLGHGATVVAVEIDHGLSRVLRDTLGENVLVVEGDALRIDLEELLQAHFENRTVSLIANLPYNVATPVVVQVLESVPSVSRMLVMVQREVGERLAASPGTKQYGAPSARVAYFATARVVGRVAREVFYPVPGVSSALVEVVRKESVAVPTSVASYDEISAVIKAAFSGRRKMLRRALAGIIDEEAFGAAEIAPTERAERLDIVAFGKLTGCQAAILSSRTPS